MKIRDHVGNLTGTRAKGESKRIEEKIRGASSAKGENKMHEGGK